MACRASVCLVFTSMYAAPAFAQIQVAPTPAVLATAAPPATALPAAALPATSSGVMTGVEPKPVTFDLGVATEFPIMTLGAQTVLEVPYGLQIRAEIGWLGSPYTDAINGFLDAVGAYGSGNTATETSELIGAALHNSLVVRAGAGWRPFAKHGFEVFGGYTLVALGGSLGAEQAITALTGKQLTTDEQRSTVTISSTLHNFNVGFGWRWLFLNDHLVLRTSGEYLQTVASSTSLTLQSSEGSTALPNISSALNSYLSGVYATYIKTPVLSLGLAYRF